MRYAYVVFARDKAPWVADTVRSVLAQTYSPMDIYFSDQGSIDGTLDVIRNTVNGYNGPNRVTMLECPKTERRGRAGLIEHINWLHDRIDADYWITSSADDLDHPDRAKRTVETIEGLDRVPLFFATAQFFMDAELQVKGITAKPDESKWVTPIEHIRDLVGGSSSGAWSPKLLADFGPMPDTALVDLYMPFCAALMDGLYFLHEHLHSYVARRDPANTGLQGRSANAKSHSEQERIREMVQCELVGNLFLMTRVVAGLHEHRPSERLDEILHFMYGTILTQANGWSDTRQDLIRKHIRPGRMPH